MLRRYDTTNVDSALWQNQRSSSTRYCRPIKFLFTKETTELTRSEVNKIEEQIQAVYATKVDFQSEEIFVNHKMLLTMVDGKVCSVLAKQSFQKCYIYGAMLLCLVRHGMWDVAGITNQGLRTI